MKGKKKFITADIEHGWETVVEAVKKYTVLPFRRLRTTLPDRYRQIGIQRNLEMPMRDGTLLRGDLYMPKNAGLPLPVILIRMPYGKGENYCWMPLIGKFWARQGYICCIQDVRGRFASEGKFEPFVHEQDDGYDTIDWIARQHWCNGNIGMPGESYYGYTCWAAAASAHSALKCIAPSTTSMEIYDSWVFCGGAFCLQTMGVWAVEMDSKRYQNYCRLSLDHLPLKDMAKAAGLSGGIFEAWMEHPEKDRFWDPVDLTAAARDIRIPVLHFGGWYDVFLKSTIEDWQRMRAGAGTPVRGGDRQWLCIGPWDHEYTPEHTFRAGRIEVGREQADMRWRLMLSFFDRYVQGKENGFEKLEAVSYYTVGTGTWKRSETWPPEGVKLTPYHFHRGGRLDPEKPQPESEGAAFDTYTYDPACPVCISDEIDLWHLAEELPDRSGLAARSDVLCYDSQPLPGPLTLTGPVWVTLFAESSAEETDFTAALTDVFPDGYAQLIQEGIFRTTVSPQSDGGVMELHIDLWATSYCVGGGHRLRVEISSSNFSRYDRNLNIRGSFGTGTEWKTARQNVYRSAEHPSCIVLPVQPAGQEG